MSETPWHAVLCFSSLERKVELEIRDFGYETFCPRVKTLERGRGGGKREVLRPLVSGYVFARFDGSDAVLWHRLRDVGGVYGFVGGASPVPIYDDSLAEWFAAADGDGVMPVPEIDRTDYGAGDCVVVTGGPFADHRCRCIWLNSYGAKLVVTIFGRLTELFIPHGFLRRGSRVEAEEAGLLQPRKNRKRKGRGSGGSVNKFLGLHPTVAAV